MAEAQDINPAPECADQPWPDPLDLAREQQVPHGMVVGREMRPVLVDDMVVPSRIGGKGERVSGHRGSPCWGNKKPAGRTAGRAVDDGGANAPQPVSTALG